LRGCPVVGGRALGGQGGGLLLAGAMTEVAKLKSKGGSAPIVGLAVTESRAPLLDLLVTESRAPQVDLAVTESRAAPKETRGRGNRRGALSLAIGLCRSTIIHSVGNRTASGLFKKWPSRRVAA